MSLECFMALLCGDLFEVHLVNDLTMFYYSHALTY